MEWDWRNCLSLSPLTVLGKNVPTFYLWFSLSLSFHFPFSASMPISFFPLDFFFNPDVPPYDFFPFSRISFPLCLFSLPLLSRQLFLFSSLGIACLKFHLCVRAAGWIRAWTGPTNHPDLQDSFSITSPMQFHLHEYT